MVEYPAQLDLVFRALGDRTRRAMLAQLASREHTVGELAEPYRITLASASKHIKSLERAGLVKRTIRGRTHFVRLDPRPETFTAVRTQASVARADEDGNAGLEEFVQLGGNHNQPPSWHRV